MKKLSAIKKLEWNATAYGIAGVAILAVAIGLTLTDPMTAGGAMPAIPFLLAILGLVVFLAGLIGVMLLLHAQALVEGASTNAPAADLSDDPR